MYQFLVMLRAADPAMTVGDYVAMMEEFFLHAECKHCGKPIVQSASGDWPWRHTDGANSRGCRAASFDPDEGWNETLRKTYKAEPKEESTT